MAQMGFFDLSDRYASLDAKKDPLVELDAVVPWEDFRAALEQMWRKPDAERKSRAGRKPMDAVLMFKTLVLASLYNLSDDQIEYQIRDRLSFMRFLGLGLDGRVPDAKTVWLYREALARAGVVEVLFSHFDGHLARQGYIARGGQILDTSIVRVPINRNTRDENAALKQGKVTEDWADKPAKRSQKDMDARWTKKHGKSHFGYKNHVNVDRRHKLIRRYHVSDAALHDSQAVDHLLMRGNTGSGVWAEAAYRSEEMEGKLLARGLKAISKDERFRHLKTKWVFWAISNDLDVYAAEQADQKDVPRGRVYSSRDVMVEIWVKTWSEVISECKARLRFVQEKLEANVDRDNALAYLKKTYHKYLIGIAEDSTNFDKGLGGLSAADADGYDYVQT